MTARTLVVVGLAAVAGVSVAQKAPAVTPDVLVFVNGERLSGQLERASADGVVFKSAMAGEVTVKWANVKELQTERPFALLTKGERLSRRTAESVVPVGKVSVRSADVADAGARSGAQDAKPTDGKPGARELVVATAAGPRVVPVAEADRLVDAEDFRKAVERREGPLAGWGGTVSGGVSLVRATQDSTTYNAGVALVRAVPLVDWLPARSRTTIDYTQSYGTVSQPATQTIETNIFHAAAEQDRYFSPRVFAFGSATFDHNFSSNLDLQSAYGGGLGVTVLKDARRTLDLKGDVHYEKLTYFNNVTSPTATAQNQNLFGSTFSEKYLRYLRYGLVLNEFGSISPAWHQSNSSATQPNAYSAHVNASLGFPVFKGLGFSLGAVDDYLNNAPVGSKRNSVQYTTNLTYTLKPK